MEPEIVAVIYVLMAFLSGVTIGWMICNKEKVPKEKTISNIKGYYNGHADGYNLCYDTKVAVRLSNGRFSKPGSA